MRYAPGATAGIAVGCAFAGAAIASAVFLLVYRHKLFRRSKPSDDKPSDIDNTHVNWELLSYRSTLRSKIVLDLLPRDAVYSGKTLKSKFSGLEVDIGVFIWNYTHTQPIPVEAINSDRLHDVLEDGADAWSSTQWSAHLCGKPNRTSALKSYIARVLCARIDPIKGDPARSFLPPDVLRVYQATLPGKRETFSDHLTQQLRDYWRTISATMLKSQYPIDKIGKNDPRLESINKTYDELLEFLKPFMDEQPKKEALKFLRDLVIKFATEGYLFFYHTDLVQMGWPSGYSPNDVIIFPKLSMDYSVKLGSDEGNVFIKTLCEPSVERLYDSNLKPLQD